jgi:hypothetical protein
MRDDFWIGRHGAAMTPAFMLPRKRPSTGGERDALFLPVRRPPPGRAEPDEADEPDRLNGRGR